MVSHNYNKTIMNYFLSIVRWPVSYKCIMHALNCKFYQWQLFYLVFGINIQYSSGVIGCNIHIKFKVYFVGETRLRISFSNNFIDKFTISPIFTTSRLGAMTDNHIHSLSCTISHKTIVYTLQNTSNYLTSNNTSKVTIKTPICFVRNWRSFLWIA